MIMRVAMVSKPHDPVKVGWLSQELLSYNLTREEIMQGCTRYAESVASSWREIQLCDFTNHTITSERQLREEIAKLEKEKKAFEEEKKRFYQNVQKEVERRLEQTYIELKNVAEIFQKSHRVVASRAVESAMTILRDEQRQQTEELCKEILRNIDAKSIITLMTSEKMSSYKFYQNSVVSFELTVIELPVKTLNSKLTTLN
jgi:hypothetical protein